MAALSFEDQIISSVPQIFHSDERWLSLLGCHCSFGSNVFLDVMLNLIKNPNITSSHVFRADILYDSDVNDISFAEDVSRDQRTLNHSNSFTQCMKAEYRPRGFKHIPASFSWRRTIVRQMIPRNPQLDRPLVQTCHFMIADPTASNAKAQLEDDEVLIVFVPHADSDEDVPWYHPKVEALAFLYKSMRIPSSALLQSHTSTMSCFSPLCVKSKPYSGLAVQPMAASLPEPSDELGKLNKEFNGRITLHAKNFKNYSLTERVHRTALRLLQTIHKHGHGILAGYVKRSQHDQLIPQRRFQETYVRLKAKYSKTLLSKWVEQTDPTKHVFEDLGIAAFLMELWRDMYGVVPALNYSNVKAQQQRQEQTSRMHNFPGFVDIGCGNGILVYVLVQEGYHGWGFDARKRKTWDTFSESVRKCLKTIALLPWVLQKAVDALPACSSNSKGDCKKEGTNTLITMPESGNTAAAGNNSDSQIPTFGGNFKQGTFIISNHADELTVWTPILAYLSYSPFVAIPCCSHDLSGTRFRAPVTPATKAFRPSSDRSAHYASSIMSIVREMDSCQFAGQAENNGDERQQRSIQQDQSPRQNFLIKGTSTNNGNVAQDPLPSAYASLCGYVSTVAIGLGFEPEREMLRIPSTRNTAIIGRRRGPSGYSENIYNSAPLAPSSSISRYNDDKMKTVNDTETHVAADDFAAREQKVHALLRRELGDMGALKKANHAWITRVRALQSPNARATH